MRRIVSFFMGILMFVFPTINIPKADLHPEQWTTNYRNIFVHGLNGWGEYSPINKLLPYWGTFGGSMIHYLNARGIRCRSASIDVNNSAWDCACELYAQITGTRTDYGAAHAARCHHARYGADYTGRALAPDLSAENKINLYGHSFGGVTILMLAELMQFGSEEEQAAVPQEELSPLFTGGKGDWIYSMTTLCAPLNGTTAYEMLDHRDEIPPTVFSRLNDALDLLYTTPFDKGKASYDNCAYEMHIDQAMALTGSFAVQPNMYYFSLPCSKTEQQADGSWKHKKGMEWIMADTADSLGKYTCTTAGGFVVDETWLENDGLVNTISQRAPFNAPQKDFEADNTPRGVWNIYPTFDGDHMSPMGGLFSLNGIRELYTGMIDTINSLPTPPES